MNGKEYYHNAKSSNDFSYNPSNIVMRAIEQCASCTYKFDKIKLSLIRYLCNTIKIYPFKGLIHTVDLGIHKLQAMQLSINNLQYYNQSLVLIGDYTKYLHGII